MKGKNLAVVGAALTIGLFVGITRTGDAGQADAIVRLQATTPGTQQIGNSNLSGTMKVGQFQGGGAGITSVNADLFDGLNSTDFLSSQLPLVISGADTGLNGLVRVTNTVTNASVAIRGTSNSTTTGFGIIGSVGTGATLAGPGGVAGTTNLTTGSGVYGGASSNTGVTYGGRFTNSSTSGTGVLGASTAVSGQVYGVSGTTLSSAGFGVFGVNNATGGVAVLGSSASGIGIKGFAPTGVFGTTSTSLGVGVQGETAFGNSVAILGDSLASTSVAGSFQNVIGSEYDVELSGPNGAIDTKGFVYREYTASTRSVAIPIAYGSITSTGTINSGTGNYSVAHTVTGEFEITIDGETYSNTTFTANANVVFNSVPYCATIADGGSSLRVCVWNLSTGVKADAPFHFVAYKTNPSEPGDFGYSGVPEDNSGSGRKIFRREAGNRGQSIRRNEMPRDPVRR